ncbi:MAG: hypothetical protein U9R42_12780 [Bacteroidota bacterium]|nr:hypothetical protein [Bacteroidota bacterium]
MMEEFQQNLNNLQGVFTKFTQNLAKILEDINFEVPNIGELIRISFEQLPESLKELNKHGWFMTLEMSPVEIHTVSSYSVNGNLDKVDDFFVNHISELNSSIEKELYKNFPLRMKILKEGFQAHRKGNFHSSILIFLSQSDGICRDITGFKLYNQKKGKPIIKKYLEELDHDSFAYKILQQIAEPGLINSSERDLSNYNGSLNRHEIMHGISTNFGNVTNSLKAISLLNYVGRILWTCIKDDEK